MAYELERLDSFDLGRACRGVLREPVYLAVRVNRRIWFVCIIIIVVVLGYDRWAEWSIRKQFIPGDILVSGKDVSWATEKTITLPNFALRDVSVSIGQCGPNHFWGSIVSYREDDTELPREHSVHLGHACRDWANGRWILMRDINAGWHRYWK